MITYWNDAQDGSTWEVHLDPLDPDEPGSRETRTRVLFRSGARAFETVVRGRLSISELEHGELATLLDRAMWGRH